MKQFVAIILLITCQAAATSAQTFTARLQKEAKNQGTVTVNHDAAIDELVNGTKPDTKATPVHKHDNISVNAAKGGTKEDANTARPKVQTETKTNGDNDKREAHRDKTDTATSDTTEPPAAELRKKVMRNSYKVDGYRVQAFAGGNTRRDRQKAEQTGNNIKKSFPNEPVYVHFYSPRWICRVGNYRSYEAAHQMLLAIRKLGYKQASVVKGKISIQY